MRYFTADFHAFHWNIIDYCKRPFTRYDMHDKMVALWNETVKPEDEVVILGDLGKASSSQMKALFSRLNGTLDVYCGNHDKFKNLQSMGIFRKVYPMNSEVYLDLGQHKVRIHHLPYKQGLIMPYDRKFVNDAPKDNGEFLLCGHIHQHWLTNDKMINVGVDKWGFKPVSEERILETIEAIKANDSGWRRAEEAARRLRGIRKKMQNAPAEARPKAPNGLSFTQQRIYGSITNTMLKDPYVNKLWTVALDTSGY